GWLTRDEPKRIAQSRLGTVGAERSKARGVAKARRAKRNRAVETRNRELRARARSGASRGQPEETRPSECETAAPRLGTVSSERERGAALPEDSPRRQDRANARDWLLGLDSEPLAS